MGRPANSVMSLILHNRYLSRGPASLPRARRVYLYERGIMLLTASLPIRRPTETGLVRPVTVFPFAFSAQLPRFGCFSCTESLTPLIVPLKASDPSGASVNEPAAIRNVYDPTFSATSCVSGSAPS